MTSSNVDRSKLPDVGPDPSFALPVGSRVTLPNGLEVRAVSHGELPIVTFALIVRTGSSADPAGLEGLIGLLADLADEGTGALDAIGVSEALASIGADYDVDVGADATVFSLTTLARFGPKGASLLADMITRPRLAEADFTRVRQLRRDRVRQLKDVPAAVAERAFLHLLYGAHVYGHAPMGEDDTLARVRVEDVASAHGALVRPARATLVVAGGIAVEDLIRMADDAFGSWAPGASVPPASNVAAVSSTPRLALVARPGAAQSELRIGRLVAPRRTPDYFPLVVTNAVVGGQFVSRINLKLREEKGYTYGARTGFDWHLGVSPLALHTSVHTAATAAAITDALGELEALRSTRPVTEDELALAKASLTRGYPQNFQTVPQVARALGQLALYDLPDTYFHDFVSSVHRVTAADVSQMATSHLDPAAMTVLVVGDPAVVGDALRERPGAPLEILSA